MDEAIDDVLGCMEYSNRSYVSIFRESVTIEYSDIPQEGVGGRFTCEANYIEIDKDEIEKYAPSFSTSYMNLFAVTLIHEFIHARDSDKYGCPPWENDDYPWGTNEQQMEAETFRRADIEFQIQFGIRSPLDPLYDPDQHGPLSCSD